MKSVLVGLFLLLAGVPLTKGDVLTLNATDSAVTAAGFNRTPGPTYLTIGAWSVERSAHFLFDFSSLFSPDNQAHVTVSAARIDCMVARWGSPDPVDELYADDNTSWTADTIPYDPPPGRSSLLATVKPAVGWTYPTITSDNLTHYIADQLTAGHRLISLCVVQPAPWDAANYDSFFADASNFQLIVTYTYLPSDNLTIHPNGGSFATPQTVTVSGGTAGAVIHYTLNGGDPTESDPIYDNLTVLTVDQTLTVKARGFLTGYAPSAVARADFSFPFVGTKAVILPRYDIGVDGPPWYSIREYPNFYLMTNYSYDGNSDSSIYCQFDLSSGIPALPDWATGYRINGVQFCGPANDAGSLPDSLFQDGLYLVPSNAWDNNTITYSNKPARSALLCAWDFPSYGTNYRNWFYASGPGLKSQVQATVDNATSKLISFNVAALNPPNPNAGYHRYLDNLSYDSPGTYPMRLWVYYDVIAGPPVDNVTISPNGGTFATRPQSVTLACTTPGAVIHFTTDGTDPTSSSPTCSGSLVLDNTTVLKAKAYKSGNSPSATAKALFTLPTVGTLISSIAAESSSATYVNLGPADVLWFGNFCDTTVKAFVKFNMPDLAKPTSGRTIIHSAIFTWYSQFYVGALADLPLGTLYQVPDNSWSETGVTYANAPAFGNPIETFRYPGTSNQPVVYSIKDYVQAIVDNGSTTISLGGDAPCTYINGAQNRFAMWGRLTPGFEPRLTVDYTIEAPRVATPVITPAGGTFDDGTNVTITCATLGAVIRYTMDGTDPDNTSSLYTGPFAISLGSSVLTVKAIAYAPAGSSLFKSLITGAVFDTPDDFNIGYVQPSTIPYGTATVDGDLSDWSQATWIPLNSVYDGSPSDIAEAYYAARWTPNNIYVAVKVRDTIHWLTDDYTAWNARDAVELYLHTNGYSMDTTYPNAEPAQQYTVGVTDSNRSAVWTALGNNNAVPSVCNLQAAGKEDGSWLYYEAALTPFQYMGGMISPPVPSVASPVVSGQYIGFDVVVVGSNGWYTGMKAETSLLASKNGAYKKFNLHQLTGEAPPPVPTPTPTPTPSAAPLPGDANHDSRVTFEDFSILQNHYGQSGMTWDEGDFSDDGRVTFEDFSILQNHYGQSQTGSAPAAEDAAVTNPCSLLGLVLLALAALGLLALRNQD